MPLDRHKTVAQALRAVERNPDWPDERIQSRLDMPVSEMIARNLFDIALHPDASNKASMQRCLRAQRIIMDRLTGTRQMGTHPAVRNQKKVQILDMTSPEGIEQ